MPKHPDEIVAEAVGAYIASLPFGKQRQRIERLALLVVHDRGWTATEIIERLEDEISGVRGG
jgi:hypothetical protein